MHVLKNWELSESLENIDQVIDLARKKEILNEHEKNDVKSSKDGSLEESRKLMKMVSYYGDQLQTFLDILNETGNKQLAKCISEKKNEFVFMIRSKKEQDHCSLLPHSIPTQFIYKSNVKDVIDKVKEKYECRKPIADRLYVVVACKDLSEIFTKGNEEDEMSCLLIHMYNIFGESKEIKVIVNIDSNTGKVKCCFLPSSMIGNIEMYIIESNKDEQLKDFECCENVMDLIKKIPDEKMNFYYNYMRIIMMQNSERIIQTILNNKIKHIKVESTKTKDLRNAVSVQEIKPEIKKFIIFFTENYWKAGVLPDYIKNLFTNLSGLKKKNGIDIVIRKTEQLIIPENISVKKFDWDMTKYVSFYAMDEKNWKTILASSMEKQISVDDFLREYCSKIEYVEEK